MTRRNLESSFVRMFLFTGWVKPVVIVCLRIRNTMCSRFLAKMHPKYNIWEPQCCASVHNPITFRPDISDMLLCPSRWTWIFINQWIKVKHYEAWWAQPSKLCARSEMHFFFCIEKPQSTSATVWLLIADYLHEQPEWSSWMEYKASATWGSWWGEMELRSVSPDARPCGFSWVSK